MQQVVSVDQSSGSVLSNTIGKTHLMTIYSRSFAYSILVILDRGQLEASPLSI